MEKIKRDTKTVISQIPELQLTPEMVSVFIPADRCVCPKELIVTIVIYKKKGRTDAVFKKMTHNLAHILKITWFPDFLVEVNPVVVDPAHCSTAT